MRYAGGMRPSVVPFRSPSREAHPAGVAGGDLRGGDRSGDDPAGPPAGNDPAGNDHPAAQLSFVALRAIAAGLARVQATVPMTAGEDPTEPRSLRLLATTFYDVWLITWPDGSGLAAHDHGAARSVLQVVSGQLVETVTERHGPIGLAAAPNAGGTDVPDGASGRGRRLLRAGDAVEAEASTIHELANRSGGDVSTIHVYSPSLADVAFYDVHPAGPVVPRRTTSVVERQAQAS